MGPSAIAGVSEHELTSSKRGAGSVKECREYCSCGHILPGRASLDSSYKSASTSRRRSARVAYGDGSWNVHHALERVRPFEIHQSGT